VEIANCTKSGKSIDKIYKKWCICQWKSPDFKGGHMVNQQQPIYLFAGGRGKKIFSSFSELGKIVKRLGKKRPEIALVGVASLKDNLLIFLLMAGLIKSTCRCRVRRVTIAHAKADIAKAKETLQKADLIFISGGDAEEGMRILKEKNVDGFIYDLVKQGKPILGMSAGTIMISREWVRWQDPEDDTTAGLYSCMGLAPVICDTHAEGDDWVELKAALQLKPDGAVGYGIPSGAYLKAYPDGWVEAQAGDVARFCKNDGEIHRLSDLLPPK
jgi:peptidase E